MFKMCVYVFESVHMHVHAVAEYGRTYDCWVPIDVVLSSVEKVNGRGR